MSSLPHTLGRFICHFVKQQPYAFLAIQVLSLAWALDNTVWPYAFKLLIDKLMLYHGDKQLIWAYLTPVLWFWGSTWLTIELMFRGQGWCIANTFPAFEKNVRMAMFRYATRHSYDYFSNHFSGALANQISDMTQSILRIMQLLLTLFIPAFVSLLIASCIFFTIAPVFAALLVSWLCIHMLICFIGGRRCSNVADDYATSRSVLSGQIVDAFTNIMHVHLFARHRFEYYRLQHYQKTTQRKHRASLVAIEKIKVALGIACFLGPGLLLTWLEIRSWQQGLIQIGDLILVITASNNMILIAWLSGLELPNLFKEIGICQQALSIITHPHDITDTEHAKKLQVTHGQLAFSNVTFAYADKHPLFNALNVTLEAGSTVGLVGFSGSGKTTFANLIMRFYEPQQGAIFLDGQDIRTCTMDSLHRSISMIPQDPSLFHRSLMDNIRYGNVHASDAEVILAAKQAYCHDFITALPEGYHTLVGERGVKLSGGQRQRIAIARCLLKKAKLLILDEATSALDSVTEKAIQHTLQSFMRQTTTIVIAHRLATLAQLDRILVFSAGKIIEDGSHHTLLNQQGHYATLWHLQAGGFLPLTADPVL